MKIRCLMAGAVLAMTVGCATLESAAARAPEMLAAQAATLETIARGSTHEERVARAERIVNIAQAAVKDIAEGATLDRVTVLVQERIAALNLDPAETLVANDLMLALNAYIRAKIAPATQAASVLVDVNTVLGWVISAAKMPVR